ncbi:MAG: hypothetical protein NWE95_08945 [Candidatus Bathyarchaeota archaeon]|nr:hypothetical protein [Candidatus Bathyarchaeota archaeon]
MAKSVATVAVLTINYVINDFLNPAHVTKPGVHDQPATQTQIRKQNATFSTIHWLML